MFVKPYATSAPVLFIKMYLKSAMCTGRQATSTPHVYVRCVCVSMCDAKWDEGWNTAPPPSSHHSPHLPHFYSLAPVFLCCALTGMCPLGRPSPPTTTCTPSISKSGRFLFSPGAFPHCLQRLSLISQISQDPLFHSLFLFWQLPSTLLPCYSFSFSPLLSSPSLSCSSLVGPFLPSTWAPWWDSCFLPQRSFSVLPILHCRSSREPQTLQFSKFILLLQARLAPAWHVVLLISEY